MDTRSKLFAALNTHKNAPASVSARWLALERQIQEAWNAAVSAAIDDDGERMAERLGYRERLISLIREVS